MQNNAIQCNTIQYNTIQCNKLQYNTKQYSTIKYNAIQYNAIQYKIMQYNKIQCNAIHCNAIQYSTIQYNTIQYNTIQYNTPSHCRSIFRSSEKIINLLTYWFIVYLFLNSSLQDYCNTLQGMDAKKFKLYLKVIMIPVNSILILKAIECVLLFLYRPRLLESVARVFVTLGKFSIPHDYLSGVSFNTPTIL